MQRPNAKYEAFLAAVMRGEAPAWPNDTDAELMLELGNRHGVNTLVESAYREIKVEWPEQYTDGLAADARQQTGHEILRRRELVRLLDAFGDNRLQPLIMKGAALAYTHYPSPTVRPRCDIDLLVAEADREACDRLLLELDYTRGLAIPGQLINYEQCYYREQAGFSHLVDLHWKINNRQVFARSLTYEDLLADAAPVAAIGKNALTLSPVHELLLACMHRVSSLCKTIDQDELEGFDGDRMIWLYDIDLMRRKLNEAGWRKLVEVARRHGIVAVVRDGLERTTSFFGAAPQMESIELVANHAEHSARLLNATRRQVFINDLSCLSWPDRLRFIKETLLPPRSYMRDRYGRKGLMAWQYLSRAAGGLISPGTGE